MTNPDCAKDFKNINGVLNKLGQIGFADAGALQFQTVDGQVVPTSGGFFRRFNPCFNALGCYNPVTGSIRLNGAVNWADPNNTGAILDGKGWTYPALNAEAGLLGLPAVTSWELMDIVILHELEHYSGVLGNPDDPNVERQLWNDCIKPTL